MRIGTPGFQPRRLVQAREARGIMSREALARLVGKNSSTIYRWEEGQASPEPEVLQQLASVLNIRIEFFLRQPRAETQAVFFRSLATALKKDIVFQKARMLWLQEVADVIQDYVEFPAVDVPDLLGSTTFKQLRNDDLERIAMEMREHWKLGEDPIPNVVEVMEQAGVVIGSQHMGTTKLDGLNQWSTGDDARPHVLLADDKMSFARRQMDAAHELAHCILHRHVTPDELRDDFDLIENQAFRLGSAFLMPSASYVPELPPELNLNSLLLLKDRWKVSVKAQVKRAQDLKLVDADDARYLYKSYSARGWASGEPFDSEWPLQHPRMLAESLNAIVDSQMRTKAELLQSDFAIPAADIESLCGLAAGWFDSQQPSIVKLVPRSGDATPSRGSADIVKFERPTDLE